jgi:BASS family bile acid:Na+ symporter
VSGWLATVFTLSVALVLLGLGATLTVRDFTRLQAVALRTGVALLALLGLLPAVAFALGAALELAPPLLVGLVAIAGAPAGPLSAAFSKLVHGDGARAVSFVAVSTVGAALSLPVAVGLAAGRASAPPLETSGAMLALVLLPVAAGVWVHRASPRWALRLGALSRGLAVALLVVAVVAVATSERSKLIDALPSVGVAVTLLNLAQLAVGRLLGDTSSALAFSVRNGAVAWAAVAAFSEPLGPTVLVPITVYAAVQSLTTGLVVAVARRTTRAS